MSTEKEIARFVRPDVGFEDHGLFVWKGCFEGDGWGQGFGAVIDVDFIRGMLATCRVDSVRDLEGRAVWVTHSHDRIHKVEPLFAKDGERCGASRVHERRWNQVTRIIAEVQP